MVDTSQVWLFVTWNVASVIKELSFQFYFILIHFNNQMWLVAIVLETPAPD